MEELTAEQIERLDYLHNKIFELIKDVTPAAHRWKVEWDMESIGEVADAIEDYLVSHNICTEMEFAPFTETKGE